MNPLLLSAEINLLRLLLILGHMNRMADQLVNSLALGSGNGDNRDSQGLLHLIDQDRAPVLPQLIHHIEGHYHRHAQLQKLHRQIEISLNIGRIHNIDNSLRLLPDNKFPCHNLLTAVGRHGVNTRQICNQRIVVSLNHAVLPVYCHSRKISYMLLRACQLIKQRRLSAVLIPHQGEGKSLSLRQGIFILPAVKPSALSVAWMMLFRPLLSMKRLFCLLRRMSLADLNIFCVCQPDCQLVAVDPKFYRISHGSILYHCYLCPLNQSHIQEMLAQGTASAYCADGGCISNLKFTQFHLYHLFSS